MSGYALSVDEVGALARRCRSALTTLPLPTNIDPGVRHKISEAQGYLDELLLLIDFVLAVDAGQAVVVDRDGPR